MMRIVVAMMVAMLALVTGPALAQEKTVTFEAGVHLNDAHAVTRSGTDDHVIGVASFRGIAMFPDIGIADYRYDGGYDFVAGSGGFHGYALWVFEDGTRLSARYIGEGTQTAAGGLTFKGTFTDMVGTGDFEGMKGAGTFTGRRIDSFEEGGDTYWNGELVLIPMGE